MNRQTTQIAKLPELQLGLIDDALAGRFLAVRLGIGAA